MLERHQVALRVSYQIWFGCVPTCVGLPKTQTSISVYDTKLHETFREQISDCAEMKNYPLFYTDRQKQTVGCSSCICTHIKNLYSLQVMLIVLQLSPKPAS